MKPILLKKPSSLSWEWSSYLSIFNAAKEGFSKGSLIYKAIYGTFFFFFLHEQDVLLFTCPALWLKVPTAIVASVSIDNVNIIF